MIKGFTCKETRRIFDGQRSSKLPSDIHRPAFKKLLHLVSARNLEELRTPPGNRLEALSGDRKGQHSIRVNNQWRICFVAEADGFASVEIVDYH